MRSITINNNSQGGGRSDLPPRKRFFEKIDYIDAYTAAAGVTVVVAVAWGAWTAR